MSQAITITISGLPKSGKSTVASIIMDALTNPTLSEKICGPVVGTKRMIKEYLLPDQLRGTSKSTVIVIEEVEQ